MAKVLLVSYITELLQERERVLLSAGYHVTVAGSYAPAVAAIAQEVFDAAVLGFSVPEAERTHLAQELKRANPATKILMIYFDKVPATDMADALIPTSASAEDVLRAVHHLLDDCTRERTG
jgi:DNA-binding NtrC family response regulator